MVSLASPVHIAECTYSVCVTSSKGKPEVFGTTEIADDTLKCLPMYFRRVLDELRKNPNSEGNIRPTDHRWPQYTADSLSVGDFVHLSNLLAFRWTLLLHE